MASVEAIVRLLMGELLYWSRFLFTLALLYAPFKLFDLAIDSKSVGGGGWGGKLGGGFFGGGTKRERRDRNRRQPDEMNGLEDIIPSDPEDPETKKALEERIAAEDEKIAEQLPDGVGLILGVVLTAQGQQLVPGATVWAVSGDESIIPRGLTREQLLTDARGVFKLPVRFAKNIIVHARLKGFAEGVHLMVNFGGSPDQLIVVNKDSRVVRDVRVPLPPLEQIDPRTFDPASVYIDPHLPRDPERAEDTRLRPERALPPSDVHTRVDLSPQFLPVESQGGTSACSSFAVGSVLEYLFNQAGVNPQHQVSKMFLWVNTRIEDGSDPLHNGSYGGLVCDWLQREGVCREPFWPWNPALYVRPSPGTPAFVVWQRAERDAPNQMITVHHTVAYSELVQHLLDGNPLYIAIPLYSNFILYKPDPLSFNGLVIKGREGSVSGYHALVVVGYDSHHPLGNGRTGPAFKVRNSWGSAWGLAGYCWFEADTLRELLTERGDSARVLRQPRAGKEALAVTAQGRVVLDDRTRLQEADGETINKSRDCPPLPPGIMVAPFGQVEGQLVRLADPVPVDEQGFFLIKFPLQEELLEQLTTLEKLGARVSLTKELPGVVMVAIVPDAPRPFLHIAALDESALGRGGLGEQHPENPKLKAAYSGRPIAFSSRHVLESNIVIPLLIKASKKAVIKGRVVIDDGTPGSFTGKQLYEREGSLPPALLGVAVSAYGQVRGSFINLAEPVRVDTHGRFVIECVVPPDLEALSETPPELVACPKLSKERAGVIVAATVTFRDRPVLLPHVVLKSISTLGRGGEDQPENPESKGEYSGQPILFQDRHEELNVIIPVVAHWPAPVLEFCTRGTRPEHEEFQKLLKSHATAITPGASSWHWRRKEFEELDEALADYSLKFQRRNALIEHLVTSLAHASIAGVPLAGVEQLQKAFECMHQTHHFLQSLQGRMEVVRKSFASIALGTVDTVEILTPADLQRGVASLDVLLSTFDEALHGTAGFCTLLKK